MFMPPGPWAVDWLPPTLPKVVRLVEHQSQHTIFTHFIPASRPSDGHGVWRSYYERWAEMTLERAGAQGIELIPALRSFVPPALQFESVYSLWFGGKLRQPLGAGSELNF